MRGGRGYGPAYGALLGLSGLFALAALLTLVPWPGAPWPNLLGYKSLCSFAPASTFGCALAAALTCTLRARLIKKFGSPAFVPALAILLLAAGLGWYWHSWSAEKARWTAPDAASSASVRAGD